MVNSPKHLDMLYNRRIRHILKIVFKIKEKFACIPITWFNLIQFYQHKRLGILCKIPFKRIDIVNKNFNYSVKYINDLDKDLCNEKSYTKFSMN